MSNDLLDGAIYVDLTLCEGEDMRDVYARVRAHIVQGLALRFAAGEPTVTVCVRGQMRGCSFVLSGGNREGVTASIMRHAFGVWPFRDYVLNQNAVGK